MAVDLEKMGGVKGRLRSGKECPSRKKAHTVELASEARSKRRGHGVGDLGLEHSLQEANKGLTKG